MEEDLIQIVKDKIDVKDYAEAYDSAKKLCENAPDQFESHYYMAIILKMLHKEQEAMEEINNALDIDPSSFYAFELALILFLQMKDYEYGHKLIDLLKNNQLDDILSIRWCKAWLDRIERKDLDIVLEEYIDVAKELEQSAMDYYWVSEFYLQYANLVHKFNLEKETVNWKQSIDILNKGLQSYPEDLECLEYMAWLLSKDKQYEKSQTIYEKLIRIPHNGFNPEWQLAVIYYKHLTKNADKALDLYKYILEYEEDAELHYYAGMCEFSLGNFKEAEKHFLREQEIDPDDQDGYYRLSYVYEVENRMEEALEQIDMALDIVREWDSDQSDTFIQKSYILRKMGRMEEAVKTIEEAAILYGDKFKKYPHLVDIWEQAGNWEKVEETLKDWKDNSPKVSRNPYVRERNTALIKYHLLRDNFKEAEDLYNKYQKSLSKQQREDLEILIDSLSGKTENNLKICARRYKNIALDNLDYPYYVLHYARALWYEGKIKKAKEMAQVALEVLDEQLKGFHTNKTVMMVQRSGALYLLGRIKEAEEQLKEAQNRPMCDFCPYGTCKDIDIYKVEGLYLQGKIEEALELNAKYHKKWPEEMDFVFYENILNKKNK